jgi:hypothetical protein
MDDGGKLLAYVFDFFKVVIILPKVRKVFPPLVESNMNKDINISIK